jgi:hypothetical protein
MTWLNGLIGVSLLAITIVGFVIVQRKIKGDDTPMFGARKRSNKEDDTEIEAFIAAYHSGQADPSDLLSGDTDVLQVVPAGTSDTDSDFDTGFNTDTDSDSDGDTQSVATTAPSPATAPSAITAPPATAEIAKSGGPAVFLRPEVKLAYLTFRSGLRDHHIFANALLRDLGYGTAVVGKVDLLVCDSSFKYVALVDIYIGEPVKDIPKSVFLSRTGVKHLSLSSKAMPKPGDLRELIYGKRAG